MSTLESKKQTGSALFTDYDLSKFLLGHNFFTSGEMDGEEELKVGMLIGRVGDTGKLKPSESDATDGSQYPIGLAIVEKKVEAGDTDKITVVQKGRVAKGKVNFEKDSDSLSTVIEVGASANHKRQYRDLLADLGLILEDSEELTDYDNS